MYRRYTVPMELGIFERVESPSSLSVVEIVDRIHANEERFRAKFEKKAKAEEEYYENRYQHVPKVGTPVASPTPAKKQQA